MITDAVRFADIKTINLNPGRTWCVVVWDKLVAFDRPLQCRFELQVAAGFWLGEKPVDLRIRAYINGRASSADLTMISDDLEDSWDICIALATEAVMSMLEATRLDPELPWQYQGAQAIANRLRVFHGLL